jgi:hypothetical protein
MSDWPARGYPGRGRNPKTVEVTVCAACLAEACWQGLLMCDEARTAGTTTILRPAPKDGA